MDGPKPDKLDNLLIQVFQEEARKIVPPSSSILWDNLQQQLENRELRKIVDEQSPKPEPDKTPKNISDKKSVKTWKKRGYLAGLTAAGLLLVILLGKTPEGAELRNFFSGFFTGMQNEKQNLTLSMRDQQADKLIPEDASEMEENTTERFSDQNRSFSTGTSKAVPEADTYGILAENSEPPDEQNTVLPEHSVTSDEDSVASVEGSSQENEENWEQVNAIEKERGATVEIAGLRTGEGPEEIFWQEEKDFLNDLNNFRDQGNNAIRFFPSLPAGYSFRMGTATKTNELLLKLYQEFENKDGLKFSLEQLFFEEETTAIETVEGAKEKGSLYTNQTFTGYITRSPENITTLTWKDGNCVLTLSGQLEDALIKECLTLLEKF